MNRTKREVFGMESTGDTLGINKTFSIGNNYNEQEQ